MIHQSDPLTFGMCRQRSARPWQQPVNLHRRGIVLKVVLFFIFVVVSPNTQFAAASAISAQTVQTDVPLPHVMSKPREQSACFSLAGSPRRFV